MASPAFNQPPPPALENVFPRFVVILRLSAADGWCGKRGNPISKPASHIESNIFTMRLPVMQERAAVANFCNHMNIQ